MSVASVANPCSRRGRRAVGPLWPRRPAGLGHLVLMIYIPPGGRSLGQPGSERRRHRHHDGWSPSVIICCRHRVSSVRYHRRRPIPEQPPGVGGGIREADVRYFYSLVTRGAILYYYFGMRVPVSTGIAPRESEGLTVLSMYLILRGCWAVFSG